jgi:Tfp pilus assembly protein PilX
MGTYMTAVWVLVGMVIMGLIVWFVMPSVMLIKVRSSLNYIDTIASLGEALKTKQDWVIKAENDYQKSTSNFSASERECEYLQPALCIEDTR